MQKYWGDVEATNKTIDESGFLRTGDIAIMDKNGYVLFYYNKKYENNRLQSLEG